MANPSTPVRRQQRSTEEKKELVTSIQAARAKGRSLDDACAEYGVVPSSYYNWTRGGSLGRTGSKTKETSRKLVAMGPRRPHRKVLTSPSVVNVHLDSSAGPDRLKICVLNGPTADVLKALELMR
jgi:transposase-like protein